MQTCIDRYYRVHRDVDQFYVRDGTVCCSKLDRYRPSSLYLIFIDTHLHGIYSDIFCTQENYSHTHIHGSLSFLRRLRKVVRTCMIRRFKFDFFIQDVPPLLYDILIKLLTAILRGHILSRRWKNYWSLRIFLERIANKFDIYKKDMFHWLLMCKKIIFFNVLTYLN